MNTTSHEITMIEEPSAPAAPEISFFEDVGASVRLTFAEDNSFMRGWHAAGDKDVQAAVKAANERERARCKAALLARLAG